MNSDIVHRDLLKFDILNFSMNKPSLWVQKKSPVGGSSLIASLSVKTESGIIIPAFRPDHFSSNVCKP